MKIVSIAVDEELLAQIDAVAQDRRQKRSDILREAARQWLKQQRRKTLMKQDRRGSRQQPVQPDEFRPFFPAIQIEVVGYASRTFSFDQSLASNFTPQSSPHSPVE